MCRFAAYVGPELPISQLVTEPENSIIHQSVRAQLREEPLNGDGFGLAWYAPHLPRDPAQFRSVSPAWSNLNLLHLARVTRSSCFFAHVRAATPGMPVAEQNCHPFVAGPLAFMHNGYVAGFHRLRRALLAELSDEAFAGLTGTTDSEHAFALLLDAWRRSPADDPLERMASALRTSIAAVEGLRAAVTAEPSLLNFALTDGVRMVVSRYVSDPDRPANTLFVQQGARYECLDGVCRMDPGGNDAVLVCSEPLSDDGVWREVPVNHLVKVAADRTVTIESL